MNTRQRPQFVCLPCASGQHWAVPQACLGELVTVAGAGEQPPESIPWRGCDVPVLNLGVTDYWRDTRGGSGLVAVVLGLQPESGDCWGVAVGSEGLATVELQGDEVEEVPEAAAERASAAFRFRGKLYQVPDLPAWQALLADRKVSPENVQ